MYNDKLTKSLAEAVKKCMDEELKGNQHKIDANKNGKIDAEDFEKLRSKKEVDEGWKKSVKEEIKSTPPKNTDVADKSYLKTMGKKPGPLHNVGKGLKAFVQGKPEPMESVETEKELLEYESKNGVYKHKGTYGTEKSLEAGETDWDKEDKKAATFVKPEKKKYGARQNRNFNTKTYKESFTGMLDNYKENGIKGLFESLICVQEEATNDEFKTELEKQKAKADGKAPQADVAKAAVQAVQQEETIVEGYTVGEKTPNKQGGHNQDVHYNGKKIGRIESYSHRTGMRYGSHHQDSGDGSAGMRSREEAMEDLKAIHKDHMSSVKEEVEQLDELSPGTLKSYVNKAKPEMKSAQAERQSAREVGDYKVAGSAGDVVNKRREGIKTAKAKLNAEEVEQVEERSLSEPEMKKREEVVKSMKKGIQGFKDRYGDRAKEVMYATATKIAKKD